MVFHIDAGPSINHLFPWDAVAAAVTVNEEIVSVNASG